MIMINGNWEKVKDLSDILRIVSENIGDEFAQKVEEIYSDYEDILEKLDYLNDQIDKLEEYIDKNADGTDFMEGMIKAFEMIERWK